MPTNHTEKRDYYRMKIGCQITFKSTESQNDYIATLQNLSGNGILFLTAHEVRMQDCLQIHIDPGNHTSTPLDVTATVIRVTNTKSGDYEVAATIEQQS